MESGAPAVAAASPRARMSVVAELAEQEIRIGRRLKRLAGEPRGEGMLDDTD
jgi:hypothetical protein